MAMGRIKLGTALIVVSATFFTACRDQNYFGRSTDGTKQEGADSANGALDLASTPAQPAQPIKITNLATSGDACPAGSVTTNISEDQQAFTLLFASFVLAIEGGPGKHRVKGNCLVQASLDLPKGWQMAVISLDRRGYASLPKGSVARVITELNFAERGAKQVVRTRIAGPYDDDFVAHSEVKLKKLSWSPCGGKAELDMDLIAVIRAKNGVKAYFGQDSLDGEIRQNLGLQWRPCK